MTGSCHRLAVLNSHPIQYFAPLYRRIEREESIDLTVYYCSRQGLDRYVDKGFGMELQWDLPLLEGYQHKFLPNLSPKSRAEGLLGLVNPGIVSEIVRRQFDALWIHGHRFATNLLGLASAKLTGTAVLMRGETHLLLQRPRWKRALRKPVMTGFYQLCDGLLAIGTRNREFYNAHGVGSDRIVEVPYTVDNDFFWRMSEPARRNPGKYREALGLPVNKVIVFFASKFIRRKRPMDLLSAFEKVRRTQTDTALAFVGNGPLEEDLKSRVREREIPDVYFLGFRNQSELPDIYGCCDVFVLSSCNEPWGLVINEVMAVGLPVITTHEVGAAPDLVQHGTNGYRYPVGDVDALADHLATLASDSDRRQEMGAESLRIIRGWSYEECVDGLRAALTTVAGRA